MASKTKLLMNVEKIRQDFPILSRTTRGKPLVYLDSAATSQKPKSVIDSVTDFFTRYNANVHRAIYELGEEATREYEGAREKVAQFIHARSPTEVAFTKSTTESINTIAYGWGIKGKLKAGDEVVSTVMEHHSNHVPWFFVQDAKGVKLKWVGMTNDGALRMEDYDEMITKRTKVVTVTQCSNVLGTINPVEEIARRAHEVGAPNMAGAIGLGVAVDYLSGIGMDQVRRHEMELTEYALEALSGIKGFHGFGLRDASRRGGVISFTLGDVHPHDIASILDVEGIAIRSGHHCAQPLMERLNVPATARASFYVYNTPEEVDRLAAGLRKVLDVFA